MNCSICDEPLAHTITEDICKECQEIIDVSAAVMPHESELYQDGYIWEDVDDADLLVEAPWYDYDYDDYRSEGELMN